MSVEAGRIPYKRANDPRALIRPGFRIEIDGINCQGFVHWELDKSLGETLDPNMRSKEIFQDESKFRTLGPKEKLVMWDVILFGSPTIDPKKLHAGVVVGVGEDGEFVIRHSSNRFSELLTEGVGEAALSLLEYLYGGVRAAKRLRTEPGLGVELPIIEKFDQ